MANYDDAFYNYVNRGSLRSARSIIPLIQDFLPISSVLDVGAGQGAWLSVWHQLGVTDIVGIDGEYVNRKRLLIPGENFLGRDLREPFNLDRKFDLVQCLEVGEHIPEDYSKTLVSSLIAHGDIVFFSAAPRGQGGDDHINEQDYDFWRAHFASFKYTALDCIRPIIAGNRMVEPWYRYNTFLYVSEEKLAALQNGLRRAKVEDHEILRDISPGIYRFRKALIRLLPVKLITSIAKFKESMVVSFQKIKP